MSYETDHINYLVRQKTQEIRRLHNVCSVKNDLLNRAANNIRLYRNLFAGKMSEEREKETDQLIDDINKSID